VGKIRGTVGLENLLLDSQLLFNERSLVTTMVPVVNPGIELWGDIAGGILNYQAGIFNGDGDGRVGPNTDFGDDKVFGARVFLQPFKQSDSVPLRGIGIGVGSSYGRVGPNAAGLPSTTGGTLPGYYSAGQQQFFAYNPVIGPVVADKVHWRFCPQATYLCGPFGLMGEYIVSEQGVFNETTLQRADVQNRAWQVSGQWVLTGESAGFTGIAPERPFDPRTGGWGAWQLLGRVSQLEVGQNAFEGFSDPTLSARSAFSWALGFNWWLNQNVRFSASFSRTYFGGGGVINPIDPLTTVPPATVSHQDENVVFTRIQLAF
jgi:phosphate-selective porin OprO/OprP